jgi:hypothetical protein
MKRLFVLLLIGLLASCSQDQIYNKEAWINDIEDPDSSLLLYEQTQVVWNLMDQAYDDSPLDFYDYYNIIEEPNNPQDYYLYKEDMPRITSDLHGMSAIYLMSDQAISDILTISEDLAITSGTYSETIVFDSLDVYLKDNEYYVALDFQVQYKNISYVLYVSYDEESILEFHYYEHVTYDDASIKETEAHYEKGQDTFFTLYTNKDMERITFGHYSPTYIRSLTLAEDLRTYTYYDLTDEYIYSNHQQGCSEERDIVFYENGEFLFEYKANFVGDYEEDSWHDFTYNLRYVDGYDYYYLGDLYKDDSALDLSYNQIYLNLNAVTSMASPTIKTSPINTLSKDVYMDVMEHSLSFAALDYNEFYNAFMEQEAVAHTSMDTGASIIKYGIEYPYETSIYDIRRDFYSQGFLEFLNQ